MRVRVFPFQTYRDANYGGLNVQRKIEFMHKERNMRQQFSSLSVRLMNAHAVGTHGGYVQGFDEKKLAFGGNIFLLLKIGLHPL
jgi:hypothetical protein